MSRRREITRVCVASLIAVLVLFVSLCPRADQIDMQNGDHYIGRILSLTTNTVVLQSDVLGTVTLPRGKIALLTLGASASTNLPVAAAGVNAQVQAPVVPPATAPKLPALTKAPASDKNLIQKVESQYLSEATPEARQKFNQMAGGLLTGRLSVNDIRKEAKSAADQLRALKADAGDDTGMIHTYLAILDNFLKESPPTEVRGGKGEGRGATTNAVVIKPKVGTAPEEE